MKKLITIITLVFISTLTFAQTKNKDVVYLKDGSIIHGTIIEQVPDQYVKIETKDGNVFVYQFDDIEEIAQESNTATKKSGYKGLLEFSSNVIIGNFGYNRIKLSFINGYQVNEHFSFGIGTGINYYHYYEEIILPVFGDIRITLSKKAISPYLSIDVGYSFLATDDFMGEGMMVNPIIGLRMKCLNKSEMHIGFGYDRQRRWIYNPRSYSYYSNIKAITMNFGISF